MALFQPFLINVENVENRSIVSITGIKSKGSFLLGNKLFNSNYGEYMNVARTSATAARTSATGVGFGFTIVQSLFRPIFALFRRPLMNVAV